MRMYGGSYRGTFQHDPAHDSCIFLKLAYLFTRQIRDPDNDEDEDGYTSKLKVKLSRFGARFATVYVGCMSQEMQVYCDTITEFRTGQSHLLEESAL